MADQARRREILRTVERASEPALSAKQIAGRMDVAVKTVHNHISDLVDSGDLETTQIGNATAYYVESIRSSGQTPTHECTRCGRATSSTHHMAKLDEDLYFEASAKVDRRHLRILCRFCYSDFSAWLFYDQSRIGDYPSVHAWDIPREQLEEVQEDPEIRTSPEGRIYDDELLEIYDALEAAEKESDIGSASTAEIFSHFSSGDPLRRRELKTGLETLRSKGWVQLIGGNYATPVDASVETVDPRRDDRDHSLA